MKISRGFILFLLFGFLVSGCAGRARDVLLGEKIDSAEEHGISYSCYSLKPTSKKAALFLLLPPAGFSSEDYLRKWVSLLGTSENILIAPDLSSAASRSEAFQVGLSEIIVKQAKRFKVPDENVFLIGESNGAIAGFRTIHQYPELFRAAVMISSAIDQKVLQNLIESADRIKTDMLMVHGTEDSVIRIQMVEEDYQSLKNVGVPVELRVVPGMGHGSDIFTDEQVVSWLKQKLLINSFIK